MRRAREAAGARAPPSPPLPDGSYTAVAEQKSEFGNGPGFSEEQAFTVHAAKPHVTLNPVSSPTGDSTPSFKGTASEHTGVTVYVFAGSPAEEDVVAEAHASGTGGSWSSGATSPALADGFYTAVAEQKSEFGTGPGFSEQRTFTVHAAAPVVTLNAVSSPTNDSTPAFTGTASEHTQVNVLVYKGTKATGSPAAEVHASGTGGAWTSGSTSTLADGTYTAVAEQQSEFGDGPGFSQERTFTINTAPPTVSLDQISTPTNDSTPSFTGFASDTTKVTVLIYSGGSAGGTPVSSAQASGTGGVWSSEPSGHLDDGSYTAVAEQPSSLLGNSEGFSEAIHFIVRTAAPTVTLNGVTSPSNNTTPTFTGTASDSTSVTIKVFAGSGTGGTLVSSATATGTGGGWTSGHAGTALPTGLYTAQAEQASSLSGNRTGFSSAIEFTVDTRSPTVSLNGIPTPSNNATPSFSGAAAEASGLPGEPRPTQNVVVHVFDAGEHEVASASVAPSGGSWKTGPLGKTLSSGGYTAVATEASSLNNAARPELGDQLHGEHGIADGDARTAGQTVERDDTDLHRHSQRKQPGESAAVQRRDGHRNSSGHARSGRQRRCLHDRAGPCPCRRDLHRARRGAEHRRQPRRGSAPNGSSKLRPRRPR